MHDIVACYLCLDAGPCFCVVWHFIPFNILLKILYNTIYCHTLDITCKISGFATFPTATLRVISSVYYIAAFALSPHPSMHPLEFANEKVACASLYGTVAITSNPCQELLRQYEQLLRLLKLSAC